jgi:hypothetical protein
MGQRDQGDRRQRRWRERLAVTAMGLFPLLVAGGFFTPGMLRVLAVAQELRPEDRAPIVDRVGPFARRPLLVPRDFSAGFIPELLDLDQLFLGSQFRVDASLDQLGRVDSFPRSHGDVIVFDDVASFSDAIVFDDVLMEEQVAQVEPVVEFGPGGVPMCATLHAANCVRDDDFVDGIAIIGDTRPIPEPHTGALLGLGLALLARRRK